MNRKYQDTYRHKGLRRKLVEQLRAKGITDEAVLEAIGNVPRHFFLDTALDGFAYEDRAFPIGEGQTISQPYTVAYQSQLLQVKPHDKILEIGTGSIYQSCILAEMGAQVYTIERQRRLFEKSKSFVLRDRYPNIRFFFGDGFEGLPTYAPFDKVLITAGAPYLPSKLINQLRVGGMMVVPLDEDGHQRMFRFTMRPDGTLEEEAFSNFSFVPMLRGKNG